MEFRSAYSISNFRYQEAPSQVRFFLHRQAKKKYVVFPVTLPTPIFGPYRPQFLAPTLKFL